MSCSSGLCLSREVTPDHPAVGRSPSLNKAPHVDLGALSHWAAPSCRPQGSRYLGLFGIRGKETIFCL